jgi:hypothetical protein
VYVDFFYLQSVKILLLYSLYNLFFLLFSVLTFFILAYDSLVVGPLSCLCSALFSVVCVQPVWVFNVFLSSFIVKGGAIWCEVLEVSQILGCTCRCVYYYILIYLKSICRVG